MDAAVTGTLPPRQEPWTLPDRGTMGVIFLIVTETALFTIFVVAYVVYIGKSLSGPYPRMFSTSPSSPAFVFCPAAPLSCLRRWP